ncbi:hypothetical protein SKAU_G00186060 [Synaphobranchus kaupii]|uniref:Secreted protein n=1 Tax=Synaphobranchus kaupii TaxID=118154 RepID=A0A9Q1FCN3_SYNKA|nr:hypothetical protein SKAU_G00186060 [Synaphobranchus kaupii]
MQDRTTSKHLLKLMSLKCVTSCCSLALVTKVPRSIAGTVPASCFDSRESTAPGGGSRNSSGVDGKQCKAGREQKGPDLCPYRVCREPPACARLFLRGNGESGGCPLGTACAAHLPLSPRPGSNAAPPSLPREDAK